MKSDIEFVSEAFLENIAYYKKSPLHCSKTIVSVLEEMLTRVEQDIANRDWQQRKANEPQSVYVVVAHNTDTERMTDFNVLTNLDRAREVFANLKMIYGGANVAMASVFVDRVKMGAPIRIEDMETPDDDEPRPPQIWGGRWA